MQDETNKQIFDLIVHYPGEFSWKLMVKAWDKAWSQERHSGQVIKKGQQTYDQLNHHGRPLSMVEMQDVKGDSVDVFSSYAKKYHLDFAVQADQSVNPACYHLWIKTEDVDKATEAMKEFGRDLANGKVQFTRDYTG